MKNKVSKRVDFLGIILLLTVTLIVVWTDEATAEPPLMDEEVISKFEEVMLQQEEIIGKHKRLKDEEKVKLISKVQKVRGKIREHKNKHGKFIKENRKKDKNDDFKNSVDEMDKDSKNKYIELLDDYKIKNDELIEKLDEENASVSYDDSAVAVGNMSYYQQSDAVKDLDGPEDPPLPPPVYLSNAQYPFGGTMKKRTIDEVMFVSGEILLIAEVLVDTCEYVGGQDVAGNNLKLGCGVVVTAYSIAKSIYDGFSQVDSAIDSAELAGAYNRAEDIFKKIDYQEKVNAAASGEVILLMEENNRVMVEINNKLTNLETRIIAIEETQKVMVELLKTPHGQR
jgi:hypothetical protein